MSDIDDRPSAATQPAQPAKPSLRSWLIVAIAAAVVLAGILAVVLISSSNGDSFTMRGTIAINQQYSSTTYIVDPSGGCQGTQGFDSLSAGAPVSVTDSTGRVVATGTINRAGVVVPINTANGTNACLMTFTVDGVPVSKDNYMVEVADQYQVTASPTEAHNGVYLTVG